MKLADKILMWTKIRRKLLVDEGHLHVLGGEQHLKPGRIHSITVRDGWDFKKAFCQTPNAAQSQTTACAVRHWLRAVTWLYVPLMPFRGINSTRTISRYKPFHCENMYEGEPNFPLQHLQHPSELPWLTDSTNELIQDTTNVCIFGTSHR